MWHQHLLSVLLSSVLYIFNIFSCTASNEQRLPEDSSTRPTAKNVINPSTNGGQMSSSATTVCQGERWDGPDESWISADCAPQGYDEWHCECVEQDPEGPWHYFGEGAGQRVTVTAKNCDEALLEGCTVDLSAPLYCRLKDVGTCWPGAEDNQWSCVCTTDDTVIEPTGEFCDNVLWSSCGEQCKTAFGHCSQTDYHSFRCACTGIDETLPPEPNPPVMNPDGTMAGSSISLEDLLGNCAEAMTEYCGERCDNSVGYCEPTANGFECICTSGDTGSFTFEELGGISPTTCDAALQLTCGKELFAPLSDCGYPEKDTSCEALTRVWEPGEPKPEDFEYSCSCGQDSPIQVVEAIGCYRAMHAACSDSIPISERVSPVELGEIGSSCDDDLDCGYGVCHFGRLHREGVCSAECTTLDDCPSDTLCAFIRNSVVGHCFRTCETFYACELLNDSLEDPLYCSDRVDIDSSDLYGDYEGDSICVPISDLMWFPEGAEI